VRNWGYAGTFGRTRQAERGRELHGEDARASRNDVLDREEKQDALGSARGSHHRQRSAQGRWIRRGTEEVARAVLGAGKGRSGREVLGRTRHRRQAVGTGAGSCGARNRERQGARHRGRRPIRGAQGWAIQEAQESELDKRTTMGIAGRTEPSACQQRAAGSVAQGAGRRGSRAVKNWRRQRLQQDFYPRVEWRRDELREEKKSKATAAGKIGGVSSVKKSERGERSAGKHLQGSQ
jgi:hypothetical protein